jgi:SAM-dependent methyltransferase
MSVEDLAKLYPSTYTFAPELGKAGSLRRALARLEYALFFAPQYRAQVRQIVRLTGKDLLHARLLDLGCGRGLRLLPLRHAGYDVHGLDIQEADVSYLRREHHIHAVHGDAAKADEYFPSECFDVVTAFNLLEHVPDVAQITSASFRLLRPGGWFVAAVPLMDSLQARWLGARWATITEVPRHVAIPSRAGMLRVLTRAGFGRIEIRPDALFNCAGLLALSLLPEASITHCYGGGRLRSLGLRLFGAIVTAAGLPWCYCENLLFGKPANAIFYAQKPDKS